jgi:D-alanyl-D-alanine carboxypeptidase
VSANAAAQPPTKLGVSAGSTIRVEDAILALVTRSANDVAVVIAENLAGSAFAFATRMTATARTLGMTRTSFRNPSGLPDAGQVTTARDIATLGIALEQRFPQYYSYFAVEAFTWNGIRIDGHNELLDMAGVNGIKTGYTAASGYNLATSLHRDDRYIVAVVMGGDTAAARDAFMRSLLDAAVPLARPGDDAPPAAAIAAATPPPAATDAAVLPPNATVAATPPLAAVPPAVVMAFEAAPPPLPRINPLRPEAAGAMVVATQARRSLRTAPGQMPIRP